MLLYIDYQYIKENNACLDKQTLFSGVLKYQFVEKLRYVQKPLSAMLYLKRKG